MKLRILVDWVEYAESVYLGRFQRYSMTIFSAGVDRRGWTISSTVTGAKLASGEATSWEDADRECGEKLHEIVVAELRIDEFSRWWIRIPAGTVIAWSPMDAPARQCLPIVDGGPD